MAGKTGYTSLAGQTLVTYAVKDDRRQVAVTLKSTQKTHYSDTKTILDFGFKRFKNVNVAENETHYITGEEPVEINGVSYLPSELYLDDTAVITLPNDAEFGDADQYLQTEIPENHPEGAVGRIIYSYNDRQIGVAWLYTTKALSSAAEPSQEAPEQTDPSSSKEPSEKKGISLPDGRLIAGAGAAVLLLIAVCGIYAAVQQRKEKERLARMKERLSLIHIFFGRLVEGLAKTRNNIVSGIDSIFSGFSAIDDDFYEEIEETLIMGDLGIQTTMAIVEDLRNKVKSSISRIRCV